MHGCLSDQKGQARHFQWLGHVPDEVVINSPVPCLLLHLLTHQQAVKTQHCWRLVGS
jgi:hypothetical protein